MEANSNDENGTIAPDAARIDDATRTAEFRRRVSTLVSRNAERSKGIVASGEGSGESRESEPESEPVKRGRGRPRLPRDEFGNIIRESKQSANGTTPEHSGRNGSKRGPEPGSERTGRVADRESPTPGPTQENPSAVGPETIGVEPPPFIPPIPGEEPKPKRRGRKPASGGPVKAQHVEMLTVQVFALAAIMKNAQHWKIQNKAVELDPWTPAAAELINKYMPDDWGEKAVAANSGVVVAMGIYGLVSKRMQMDAFYGEQARMETARDRRDQLLRQEGVPTQTPVQQTPTQEPAKESTQPRQQFVKNTGAAPTNPGRIPGLGGPM